MINKEFVIKDMELKYYIGINQITFDYLEYLQLNKIQNDKDALESLISLISDINKKFKDVIIQFIDDDLILNEEHIFNSIYFVHKAFKNEINISNSKSMELLLYLSSQRQIKKSIKAFGVKIHKLKNGLLTYLISTQDNKLEQINQMILKQLNAKNAELTINKITNEKIEKLKDYFMISDNQINVILNSYTDIKIENDIERLNASVLAIHDILCEKMSILSLEKIKYD